MNLIKRIIARIKTRLLFRKLGMKQWYAGYGMFQDAECTITATKDGDPVAVIRQAKCPILKHLIALLCIGLSACITVTSPDGTRTTSTDTKAIKRIAGAAVRGYSAYRSGDWDTLQHEGKTILAPKLK